MKIKTAVAAVASLCLAALLVLAAPLASAQTNPDERAKTTRVQLLALNDFHGALEPPAGSGGRIGATNAGGAEYLATHIDRLEATNPNTLVVSAGDLIGATPLLSGLFHDEPTIESANLFGLDVNGVGNHEFDEGVPELLRMQQGGCHPVDGCQDGDGFGGAEFDFLAANVFDEATGQTIFPPYAIEHFKGAKVAFIGMTLEETPTIVTPAAVAGYDFIDEAVTVNALIPELREQGVRTIVVLLHQGGSAGPINETTINQCNNTSGPVLDIVDRLDNEVDVVVTGHTNWAVNCLVDGKIVTGAASAGRLLTDIELTISRATKDVVGATVNNRIVTRDVKDASQTALLAKYQAIAAPIANRVIGEITADITRTANAAGESALGDVIADAQLEATAPAGFGEAVVAFMNPGGIRTDLVASQISGGEAPGEVTFGEAFAVQPFGNSLVTMTLSGAQIDTLLEQQFDNPSVGQSRMLQVSDGFTYTWNAAAPTGSKVDSATIAVGGVPVDPNASYRVTVNSFLADGGDNFSVLAQGTNRLGGEVDVDALVAYFAAHSPVAPGPQNRITRAN